MESDPSLYILPIFTLHVLHSLFAPHFTLYFLKHETENRKISVGDLRTITRQLPFPCSKGGLNITLQYISDVCLIQKCPLSQNNLQGFTQSPEGKPCWYFPHLIGSMAGTSSNVSIHGSPNDYPMGSPMLHGAHTGKNWENGHHNMGLVHELMAQKAGRQELAEKFCLAYGLQATP